MALVDEIKTMLSADATFAALMTGGTYTVAALGPLGPSRETNPTLYDASLRIKPFCIVSARDALAIPAIRDNDAQKMSTRQVVEVYFYADQYAGHTTLASARARAYVLLHGKRTATGTRIQWVLDMEQQYDRGAEDACYERSDFETYRVKG